MPSEKVLVLNATGKVGKNVCLALRAAGFEVCGTTRSQSAQLSKAGVEPVICNYTERSGLEYAFEKNKDL